MTERAPMELTPVQSSNVAALGYVAEVQELWVEFMNGGLYVYEGVPQDVADGIQTASSVGRAINEKCKGCYDYRKVS